MRYLNNIVAGLRELADLGYQTRVWTGNTAGKVSSFGEVSCDMFGGTGLGDAIADGTLPDLLGVETARVLKELDEAMIVVDSDLPVPELIESLEMKRVREVSRRALDLLV